MQHGFRMGTTIVSGLGKPQSIVFIDNQTFLVAAFDNHSIVQYNTDSKESLIVAGGNGNGTGLNQLNQPISFVIHQENNSLVICEQGNRRIVRWSHRNNTRQGEILLDNISCSALALDEQRNLYVSDKEKHEVRRYRLGEIRMELWLLVEMELVLMFPSSAALFISLSIENKMCMCPTIIIIV